MKKVLSTFILSLLIFTGCSQQNPSTPADSAGQKTAKDQNIETTTGNIAVTPADNKTDLATDQTSETDLTDTQISERKFKETNNIQMTTGPFNQLGMPSKGDTVAVLETSKGTIKIRLFTDKVPHIVENFVQLAQTGKYKNVPFHRIIKDFMIQTGDFENQNGTGGYTSKGPGTKMDDEFSNDLKHLKYTVSMANSGADTNGSQFFIVSAPDGTSWLNGKHSIFGQVFQGQTIVDEIQSAKTGANDKPVENILLKNVTIETF
jgi:peptidyl-prolyl cis-trans isomerase B (cyclophilin B)